MGRLIVAEAAKVCLAHFAAASGLTASKSDGVQTLGRLLWWHEILARNCMVDGFSMLRRTLRRRCRARDIGRRPARNLGGIGIDRPVIVSPIPACLCGRGIGGAFRSNLFSPEALRA